MLLNGLLSLSSFNSNVFRSRKFFETKGLFKKTLWYDVLLFWFAAFIISDLSIVLIELLAAREEIVCVLSIFLNY
jgi:hypothetical protein